MSLAVQRPLTGGISIRGDFTAALTDELLVPVVGNAVITVDFLAVSIAATSATTGTIVLGSKGAGASTNIGLKMFFNGHSGVAFDTPFVKTKRGESLVITTTGALSGSYYIVYHINSAD